MKSAELPLEEQVRSHEQRNLALVEKLVSMGVNPALPRGIDLHFFLPSANAARTLASGLQIRGIQAVEVDEPTPGDPDPETSLTVSVLETVLTVTTRPYIEFLVQAAAQFHGIHDGWGTEVHEAPSREPAG